MRYPFINELFVLCFKKLQFCFKYMAILDVESQLFQDSLSSNMFPVTKPCFFSTNMNTKGQNLKTLCLKWKPYELFKICFTRLNYDG